MNTGNGAQEKHSGFLTAKILITAQVSTLLIERSRAVFIQFTLSPFCVLPHEDTKGTLTRQEMPGPNLLSCQASRTVIHECSSFISFPVSSALLSHTQSSKRFGEVKSTQEPAQSQ